MLLCLPRWLLFFTAGIVGTTLCMLPSRAQGPIVTGASYQVDTSSSRVYIKVDKATNLGHVHGVEGQLASGQVTLGGAGSLVFSMTSFTADTPRARQYVGLNPQFSASDAAKVSANMHSADVLDVARFPQSTCAITALKPLDGQKTGDPGRYQLDGQFTLHGVTRPIQSTVTVERTDRAGVLHMRGSFAILQSAHGIRPFSAAGGFVRIADQLTIWGDLILIPGTR